MSYCFWGYFKDKLRRWILNLQENLLRIRFEHSSLWMSHNLYEKFCKKRNFRINRLEMSSVGMGLRRRLFKNSKSIVVWQNCRETAKNPSFCNTDSKKSDSALWCLTVMGNRYLMSKLLAFDKVLYNLCACNWSTKAIGCSQNWLEITFCQCRSFAGPCLLQHNCSLRATILAFIQELEWWATVRRIPNFDFSLTRGVIVSESDV